MNNTTETEEKPIEKMIIGPPYYINSTELRINVFSTLKTISMCSGQYSRSRYQLCFFIELWVQDSHVMVEQTEIGSDRIFLMKDMFSVEQAIEQGAEKYSDLWVE